MGDSFVLPVVSCRKINVELIFMQGGAPPHFALPVRRTWLDSHFNGWWIGRRGRTERSLGSPDHKYPCRFFLYDWPKEGSLSIKNKTIWWTGTVYYRYFCFCSFWLLKEKCWFYVFHVALNGAIFVSIFVADTAIQSHAFAFQSSCMCLITVSGPNICSAWLCQHFRNPITYCEATFWNH